jgi:hypothetical protein
MKKQYLVIGIIILSLIIPLSGCIDQTFNKNDNINTQEIKSIILEPNSSQSPIQKYFTTQKIIWTFDDYWIHFDHHPPHKGFDALSKQIDEYGGNVNIMCPFIPPWIGKNYEYEIRNYSVVEEFSKFHSGFSQDHINLSFEFFNRSYI